MSRITRTGLIWVAALVTILFATTLASSEIPRRINYQGMLTDADTGEPLTESQAMTFRLYDGPSDGSLLWSESQSVTPDSEGIFAAILGSGSPIDISFDGPVWLEVEVGGEILSPRRELVSVPYSFQAANAEMAAEAAMLDSLHADAFADTAHAHDERYYVRDSLSVAGTINEAANPVDWTRLKNVPAGFADGLDDEGGGAGDGHSLDAVDGDPVDALYVDLAGRVGIGTSSPVTPLHVSGDQNSQVILTIENTSSDQYSGERISFRDENGDAAFIVTRDPDNPDYPNGMSIGNNRSGGSIYFHTAGLPRMALDNDGQLGIGTTTPTNKLHVVGAESTLVKIEAGGVDGVAGLGLTNGVGSWELGVRGDVADAFVIRDNNASHSHLVIATNGFVGIDTVYPEERLHVNGVTKTVGFTMVPNAGTGKVLTSDVSGEGTWQDPVAQSDGDWTVVGDDLYAAVSGNVNVGEGTSNQMYPIHVRRDINDFVFLQIENRHTGISSAEGISFKHEGGLTSIIVCHDDGHAQYPGQMVIRSGRGSKQLHLMSRLKTCLFADSSGYVSVGRIHPENLLHIEGSGTDEGGVTGYGEVSARLKTTGGSHTALSVDAIADRDAIVYFAEDKEAVWGLRNDTSDANKFQLRYHGGVALGRQYLTVDSTGNAGVGTIYPDKKLHIYENSPGAISYGIKLDNSAGTAMTSTGILFKVDGGGSGRGKGAIVYERKDTWNRGDFHFLQNSDADPDEVGLADPVMTIRNNGNVGIGTSIPSSKFDVQSSATSGRLCFFKQFSASNASDVIRAETAGGGNALSGSSQDGRGVVGHSANDYAGYFNGDVYISGSIHPAACSFVIDHPLDPENKILRHNCVESPEPLLIYRGKVRLNGDGEGVVEMVDYFDAVARTEEASIHLTSVGRPFLTGAEWNATFDGFTAYGDPDREVFWEVLAERDDPVVRQMTLPVEEDKGPDNKLCDRGKLLNPLAYGYPEEMGQDYELLQGLTGE